MQKRTSITVTLNEQQTADLIRELNDQKYEPLSIPHTLIAARTPECGIHLYKSRKCVIQGKGAEDWVRFTLEPLILKEAVLGYDHIHQADHFTPHMGIDESGKGDFFGPLIIAAVYVDAPLVEAFLDLGVRDSKTISSPARIQSIYTAMRKLLKQRYAIVPIGNEAYNRLHGDLKNVNRMLAWGHARAIENLLAKVPDCPRAVADQFGPAHQIKQALMKKGRSIQLEQKHKAESDPAVAAASIIARAEYLAAMKRLSDQAGLELPRGASARVKEAAAELVQKKGPGALLTCAKVHFQTTDQVLQPLGFSRQDISEG